MEPMEEVPLKELGETESVGCPEAYLMTQIAYSESRGGEVMNVACKQSIKPLKLLSPEALFSPKCTKYRLAAGLCQDSLGELTALPRPLR